MRAVWGAYVAPHTPWWIGKVSYSTTLDALPIRFSTHCPGTNYYAYVYNNYIVYIILYTTILESRVVRTKPQNNPQAREPHRPAHR